MRYHIDTIPVWDAMRLDGECFLCALQRRTELAEADRYLGASVMEPDVRVRVNRLGFCRVHHAMFFAMSNRLGHALMLESHHQETADQTREVIARMKKAADAAAGAPLGKLSRSGAQAARDMAAAAEQLREMADSCVLCDSIRENMERYLHTVFHLYRTDSEFHRCLTSGKGVCLPHLADLMRVAPQELNARELAAFVDEMGRNQAQQAERIQEDISWFIRKFDHRFADQPWKNSKDAVPRTVNKLRGWCVGPEPNPKE
ncbi:MAG: hypothetical protein IKH77_00030 [Clostridia bacterium]|nr:hypothetical protein [Clostridia bacterium]